MCHQMKNAQKKSRIANLEETHYQVVSPDY